VTALHLTNLTPEEAREKLANMTKSNAVFEAREANDHVRLNAIYAEMRALARIIAPPEKPGVKCLPTNHF
jgi:hypothetical protein